MLIDFREIKFRPSETGSRGIPTPKEMNNHGNYVASICEIVRWLGEQAEGMGVNVFPGFPGYLPMTPEGIVEVRGHRC